ncbi:MAG TPA: DUF1343 domain-containing protein [Gemmatimonadales bacterium]
MRTHCLSLLAVIGCVAALPAAAAGQVRPGIEVLLSDSIGLVLGKRVALLTNQTGVDRLGRRDIDLLRGTPGVRVGVILSPEHGLRGLDDRPGLPDAVDSATGIPIYSLYGGTPLGALAALDSVDVVLVDLQDVGARFYSYPPTMVLLMADAARRGKPVVVLDRPNPIGGVAVQGDVSPAHAIERVGDFLPVPIRHGMTMGELARFANEVLGIHARLTVVPAVGWRRGMYYDDTGLPWIRPSPNLPTLESAIHYPGTCVLEGTNLSVGRGTTLVFQVVGAPWLDTGAVLPRLRGGGRWAQEGLTGVEVSGVTFTPHGPTDGKYDGVELRGIRLRVTDRRRYDATRAAVLLLAAIQAVHADSLRFDAARFDRLAGGSELRRAILAARAPDAIWHGWDGALALFRRQRVKYLLY